MASLLGTGKLGTASVSNLLKSASSIQNQINSYNDTIARIQYENSAKTDADFQQYVDYLSKRVDGLRASSRITDQTKALDLSQTIVSAQKSNASANIQRENIQMMAGNASLTDKYNVIVTQYQRALSIGDQALAQSLESQAYSVSQSIQLQDQQAQAAAETLAKAQGASQESVASQLTSSLKQLNNDMQIAGEKGFNKVVSSWVSSNSAQLKALGIDIPAGAQPNYFDIVNGVGNAIANAHQLAAAAVAPYDPLEAQTYTFAAKAMTSGISKLDTLAGSKTLTEVQQAAQNPAQFIYDEATGQFKQSAQTGYQITNGQVAPTYSGQMIQGQLSGDQIGQLKKLGLSFKTNSGGGADNGLEVQVSSSSPKWLQNILGKNGITNVFVDPNGNFQFEADATSGSGKSYYTIAHDQAGNFGSFEHTLSGATSASGGNYGFNQQNNSLINTQVPNTTLQAKLDSIKNTSPLSVGNAIANLKTGFGTFQQPGAPSMTQRAGGGFNFTYNNAAISAAQYAKLTGTPFRSLLQEMANKGDTGAGTALSFVGNDFGYDPTKATSYQNRGLYNALTAGAGVKPMPAAAPGSVLGNAAQLKF